ncbi:hypothetical protein PIB30_064236 [Stylosanthes scabra]|uniref:NADP-dependent oxidoreductase domain-containing protein n=1 Tax=Stylosanthes scabra TaxID=79078 RepID=A0ABU6SMK0_9FABA|nr:hypothetical protein [Stylosanthes scabra]
MFYFYKFYNCSNTYNKSTKNHSGRTLVSALLVLGSSPRAWGSPQRPAISDSHGELLLGESSRDELFITSKLWLSDNHPHLVLPAIQNSLKCLGLDYLDLYLVHCPMSAKPEIRKFPYEEHELMPFDMKGVWASMGQCHKLGLTKSIGVSNFSTKKLEHLLSFASIPPAVNQVELNPSWQQKNLREYCKGKGIVVTAYAPLGARGTSYGQ